MLETHQRAAWIANEPHLAWHHFLRSRFVGRRAARDGGAGFAIVVQTIVQQSEAHAELRGNVETFSDPALPIVCEFTGLLQLETRDFTIHEPHPNQPERVYSGQLSENGRVMTLRALSTGGVASKPFHLIHEATLAELSGG